MKKCRKVCRFRFAKNFIFTKMFPKIRAKLPKMSYLVHTTS